MAVFSKNSTIALALFLTLAGCEKSEVAKAPEPEVHNAFTDHVERGITTMNKAQSVADTTNAQSQQTVAEADSVAEPH